MHCHDLTTPSNIRLAAIGNVILRDVPYTHSIELPFKEATKQRVSMGAMLQNPHISRGKTPRERKEGESFTTYGNMEEGISTTNGSLYFWL